MTGPAITDLTDRAREVFRLVVDEWVQTGQPVGSRTISRLPGLNLSPASIRNVMQDLEDLGILAAPHTSAGRMPTQIGLRLFVDGMMEASPPTPEDQARIEQGLADGGAIETALAQSAALLSGLSACAGMVLVPPTERRIAEVAFAPLGGGRALMALVADDGHVENRVLDLPPGIDGPALVSAGNYVTTMMTGQSLGQARASVLADIAAGRAALDAAAADLVARGLAQWGSDNADRPVMIVRGQANLLDDAAIGDLDRVRQLMDELESKEELARILDSARDAPATRIFIGAENKLFSLSGSSVITAPYHGADGRVVGIVGVIGPYRLNYGRIVPMVEFTANTLSRLMR